MLVFFFSLIGLVASQGCYVSDTATGLFTVTTQTSISGSANFYCPNADGSAYDIASGCCNGNKCSVLSWGRNCSKASDVSMIQSYDGDCETVAPMGMFPTMIDHVKGFAYARCAQQAQTPCCCGPLHGCSCIRYQQCESESDVLMLLSTVGGKLAFKPQVGGPIRK